MSRGRLSIESGCTTAHPAMRTRRARCMKEGTLAVTGVRGARVGGSGVGGRRGGAGWGGCGGLPRAAVGTQGGPPRGCPHRCRCSCLGSHGVGRVRIFGLRASGPLAAEGARAFAGVPAARPQTPAAYLRLDGHLPRGAVAFARVPRLRTSLAVCSPPLDCSHALAVRLARRRLGLRRATRTALAPYAPSRPRRRRCHCALS